uniref:Uncharacterized protein n=1 Tax=Meleagris gallopavo TaxID=9103 RepID=A0A803XP77_MELGA
DIQEQTKTRYPNGTPKETTALGKSCFYLLSPFQGKALTQLPEPCLQGQPRALCINTAHKPLSLRTDNNQVNRNCL